MLSVKWFGTFKDALGKFHKQKMTFNGQDWSDIIKQTSEHIELLEDNTELDWCLSTQRFGRSVRT
jgi:hypothetical protein